MRRFDTRLERPRVIEAAWDPLPMAAAHSASLSAPQGDSLNVSVPSSKVGDLVQVTHEGTQSPFFAIYIRTIIHSDRHRENSKERAAFSYRYGRSDGSHRR